PVRDGTPRARLRVGLALLRPALPQRGQQQAAADGALGDLPRASRPASCDSPVLACIQRESSAMAEPPPLSVYPELWRQSREQCPDNWQDQFRCLCALARDYRREHRAVVKTLPEGERLFLQALDQYDVEENDEPKRSPRQ